MDDPRPPALTAAHGARWSVDVLEVTSHGRLFSASPERILSTASIGKVFALVELATRLETGRIDPGVMLSRLTVPPVGDSGLWRHLSVDELPVLDIATLIGAVSDNLATNVLIEALGLVEVQTVASRLAPGGSTLHDIVRDDRRTSHPPMLSSGCARDWARLFAELHSGQMLSAGERDRVMGWLANGMDLSMASSAFLLDPLAHDRRDMGLRFFGKTGTDIGVRGEVGVVLGPESVVAFAALVNWDPLEDEEGRGAVLTSLRSIGEFVLACARAPR